ncbi:uncharacterized protein [Aquarana catesbeiana]|uniref:uncharacterized protein n=1 Tax=Aquarana catesbeiana TaxID=8400 RepID=UPI003CC944DD
MESLRRLMSRKKDNPWKTVNDNWDELLQASHISTSVVNKDWNPWKGWCRSWEMYEQSYSKTPKSGKERAAVWRELYYLAKFTKDRLDEATAMRQQLAKQTVEFTNLQNENLLLKTTCGSLQKQFDYEATAMYKRLETQTAELTNLQKENLLLKTKCKSFQEQLHNEQCKNVMDDHRHRKELEEEVYQRQLAQNENKAILKQRDELERQLVQVKDVIKVYNYNQYLKNITIVNCQNHLEGEESWHEKAKRAGVGCPSRCKILERLEYHEGRLSLAVLNATFWQLVIRLSRHEDLGKNGISRNRSPDWY